MGDLDPALHVQHMTVRLSNATIMPLLLWLLLFTGWESFVQPFAPPSRRRPSRRVVAEGIQRNKLLLGLSTDDNNGDDSLEFMRKLLEASWNSQTMGQVPSNEESAADAAMACLREAVKDCTSNSKPRLFLIDILLPQYDIDQGSRIYDEVLVAEFCTLLTNRLGDQKSQILVRDDKVLKTVERVLASREKAEVSQTEQELRDETISSSKMADDDHSNEAVGSESSDIESFRKQLIMGWKDDPKEDSTIDLSEESNMLEISNSMPVTSKSFRFASMLGSADISTGPDRSTHVLRALVENGKPAKDEDTIIIMSANSPEETIAIRSLVAQYGEAKSFVLVNCNLQPIPRELFFAQTVYSIQPLVARPRGGDPNKFQPKIVVMRRYPADWEIFVDADGEGFELAAKFAPSAVSKKGPSMEDVADCVKKHLDSRGLRQ